MRSEHNEIHAAMASAVIEPGETYGILANGLAVDRCARRQD